MKKKVENEIKRPYREIMNEAFNLFTNEEEFEDSTTNHILLQIAYNTAHIADEVYALRKIEEKYLEESEECDEEEPEESEESEAEQKTEDEEKPKSTKKDRCMFCGKELDIKDAGGILIIDGFTYCACDKCKSRFENITRIF